MTNHYDTLGVPRDATPEQIKAAYREKRGALHPDRAGGDTEAMAALNAAHTVLSDPAARAQYDAELPDVERDARHLMESRLSEALSGDDDPIEAAEEVVQDRLDEVHARAIALEDRIARMRKHLARLKFKGAGKNVAAVLAERQIAEAKAMIKQLVHVEKVLQRTAELLQDYDYEMPEQPAPTGGPDIWITSQMLRSALHRHY